MENEFDLSQININPEDELDEPGKLKLSLAYKGIDCCTPITAKVAADLKSLGYDFACRYLVPDGYAKRITTTEAANLLNAGLNILLVYETTANRDTGGAANGAIDGAKAYATAKSIGVPESAYIYFAIDHDTSDFDTIEAYLHAAREQTGPYEIGVYGSYKVIEAMKVRAACKGFWQTYAWSYRQLSASAMVYQYKNGQSAAGITVDYNYGYTMEGFWTTDNDVTALVQRVANKIGLASPNYWIDALRGAFPVNVAYVKAVFERVCKAAEVSCTDINLIDQAAAVLGLDYSDYWWKVVMTGEIPPAVYLVALFGKIDAKLR